MKLSELKVGDKFCFTDDRHDQLEVTDIRTRIDGTRQACFWSETSGFFSLSDTCNPEVELITDPVYKPYSDLRPLVGKSLTINADGDNANFLVVWASRKLAQVGIGNELRDAQYIFNWYTHLDGSPCGELDDSNPNP